MSLYIKGLNMPKASNEDCMAVIRSNGKVEVWQTGMKEFEAQAIQIPTPHGRLIDADALKYTLKECCIDGDEEAQRWYDIMGIDDGIDDYTIAILEAEE